MKSAKWGLVLMALLVALLIVTPARADTASVDAVRDAGNGTLAVTYTVASTAAAPSAWYAYLAEDHGARACNPTWANYLRDIGDFHDGLARPRAPRPSTRFSPRQIKLCVYLNNADGHRAVAETVINIPAGYGVQRWSG